MTPPPVRDAHPDPAAPGARRPGPRPPSAPPPSARRRPPPPPPAAPRTTRLGRPPVRLRAALVLLAIVLSMYVVRLVEVQGLQAPVYAADAAEGRTVTRTLPAARGTITDRNGVVLAAERGGARHHRRPDVREGPDDHGRRARPDPRPRRRRAARPRRPG